jgi:hypothetical protein
MKKKELLAEQYTEGLTAFGHRDYIAFLAGFEAAKAVMAERWRENWSTSFALFDEFIEQLGEEDV